MRRDFMPLEERVRRFQSRNPKFPEPRRTARQWLADNGGGLILLGLAAGFAVAAVALLSAAFATVC